MGKYRHYGSHGYLMPQRPSVHSGKTWWNDFTFAYMAGRKSKSDPQFLQATELLPERLLIPLGGRFVHHWEYLEQRLASPRSVEQWVPIQDPKSTEPQWYIPYLEGVGSEGATLSTFLAAVRPRSPLGPNIGFKWLSHWPVNCGDFDYLYRGRLWLVTLRPIPAGVFLRANVQDAWKFYSWGPAATELAHQYERVFVPGAPQPILGGRVHGLVDCDFSELEYTSAGVPKVLGYYNRGSPPAPESPPSTESSPFLVPSAAAILGVPGDGPFEGGLLSRAEAFTPRGGLHPKAYEVNSNFLEDGRPLPFPELFAWWTTEVERVTALRAGLGLPEFAGPELTAIKARAKRYRKHGSDGALRLKATAGSQPRKRSLAGPDLACGVSGAAQGPLGQPSSADDSKVNDELCSAEGIPVWRRLPPRKARSLYGRREGPPSAPCSSVPRAAMGLDVEVEGDEGPQGGFPSCSEVVVEVEGEGPAAPLPNLTEYLAVANMGDHIPSRDETRVFFERVIDVLGGLANDLQFIRENVYRHMERVLREE